MHQRETIAAHLWDGMSVPEVAAKISKDPARRKHWRTKIRRWLQMDPTFRDLMNMGVQGELMGMAIPAAQGVGQRASRGRVDAAKLLFEMTGLHNPRVQKHEHSGEVKVTVSAMPRPKQIDSGPVVDSTAEEIE